MATIEESMKSRSDLLLSEHAGGRVDEEIQISAGLSQLGRGGGEDGAVSAVGSSTSANVTVETAKWRLCMRPRHWEERTWGGSLVVPIHF